MNRIAYRGGYKYQLAEDYQLRIGIQPELPIRTEYLQLSPEGELEVREGYAWDGPSGPAIDTANFMRGSLVHDALYQLMRAGLLDRERHREAADRVLRAICLEDGMSAARAWWVYWGVRVGAGPAADPAADNPVLYAPA